MHLHPRESGVELFQHARDRRVDNVVGHPQPDLPDKGLIGQAHDHLVVQRDHTFGIDQQLFPRRGQRDGAPRPVQQLQPQCFLKPFKLHRHRRLGQMQKSGRTGHAPGFGNSGKRPQRGDVQISHTSSSLIHRSTNIRFKNVT